MIYMHIYHNQTSFTSNNRWNEITMYRHPCVVLLLFKFSLALLSNLNSWIYIEKWRDRKLKQQQNSTRVTVHSDVKIFCKNAVEKNCAYQHGPVQKNCSYQHGRAGKNSSFQQDRVGKNCSYQQHFHWNSGHAIAPSQNKKMERFVVEMWMTILNLLAIVASHMHICHLLSVRFSVYVRTEGRLRRWGHAL